jgi:hypothetical protein
MMPPISKSIPLRACPRATAGRILLSVGGLLLALLSAGRSRGADRFDATVLPVLAKVCNDCHSGDTPEAGVRLDDRRVEVAKTTDRALWLKVLRQVEGGVMPPEGSEQPSDEERKGVVAWIRDVALSPDCSQGERPGRVTLRRLNRAEYDNTVRDLFGIDISVSADFPSDDVGYGFDNIGDVLSMPPVLFERALEAAEKVARTAIVTGDIESAPVLKGSGGTLGSHGEIGEDFDFPAEGEYLFRVHASGDQAGPDPVRMGFRIAGREEHVVEVPNRRRSPKDYEFRMKVPAGRQRFAVAFLNDYYNPEAENPRQRDRNLHVDSLSVIGPLGVVEAILPASHRRIFARPIPTGLEPAAEREIVLENLRPLVSRAFRRPARGAEVERLADMFAAARASGETVESSMRVAVTAMLVSPSFLFLVETDPPAGEIRRLDDHELAARLSYFLWSSMPDEALATAADRGELRSDEQIVAQARRMLADPKSRALVDNFAGQWLHLAKHYGIEGVSGAEFRRVAVNREQRGGLLGQASILAVTSNPTRTSPVKRGRWVLENLLAAPPPPPPPNVPELPSSGEALTGTLRQRMEQHRTNPSCASCHKLMDPLGFGLENFDAVGAWRTEDGPAAVDPSGELPDGRRFAGPAELRQVLVARRAEFRRCLVEKLFTYALGRGLEYYDACAVERIASQTEARGDRFAEIVAGIVTSVAFRERESDQPR